MRRRQQGTACGENSCTQGKDRRCEAFILDSPGSGAYKFFKVEKFNFIFCICAISAGAQDICKDQER